MQNRRNTPPLPVSSFARKNSDTIKLHVKHHDLLKPFLLVDATEIMRNIGSKMGLIPFVVVTPEIAERLLTLNTANRPVTQTSLEAYAKDQTEENWIFQGNMIKFDYNRIMRDGQHSLLAQLKSGTTQVYHIQTGLDPIAFGVMDNHRKRSGGDVLAIKGFSNYTTLSAAIKMIIFYEKNNRIKNNLRSGAVSNVAVSFWADKKTNMQNTEALWHFIEELKKGKKGTFLAGSTWLFLSYVLSKIDKEQAKDFITRLATGENISMSSRSAPIYLLREKLLNFGSEIGALRSGGSIITEVKVRYIFRAWNAWRQNEKITKLVIKREDKIEKPI